MCMQNGLCDAANSFSTMSAHPQHVFAGFAEAADIAGGDAADNLGERQARLLAALARAADHRAQQPALVRQQLLVILRFQPPRESPLWS